MLDKNSDYNSDEEINKSEHSRLLNEVFQLDNKSKYVKKSSRTEPTVHVSEFNLIKSSRNNAHSIKVRDLTKSLNQRKGRQNEIVQKVNRAQQTVNTLRKPLEKPEAERIRRNVAFIRARSGLNKWQSVVEKHRVSAKLTFPLNQNDVDFNIEENNKEKGFKLRIKSELDEELEKIEPIVVEVETNSTSKPFPLNIQEMLEQRHEMARLRAHQSYREAKAYKRNKIKSKTFHRIERREKLRQQIKEFELLRKTDPVEALRKLEQLEKTRAEERISLRHRSTGQWAKSKLVRAKYDKESRQAISQQLALSRDLAQKMNTNESEESEVENNIEPEPVTSTSSNTNPWIQPEVTDFVTGYRKFWENKNEQKSEINNSTTNNIDLKKIENTDKTIKTKDNNVKVTKIKKRKLKSEKFCGNSWTVTNANDSIDTMFDNFENVTQNKIEKKIKQLESESNVKKRNKTKNSSLKPKQKKKKTISTDLPREKFAPEIDDELGVEPEDSVQDKNLDIRIEKEQIQTNPVSNQSKSIKPIDLENRLPNLTYTNDNSDEEEQDEDQRAFISEAFEDDDLLEEFRSEKNETIKKNQPEDIDLSLPGWGSWGGKDIQLSKRKQRRFIIKTPKVLPRRDDNKGNLIINEHKDTKVRAHQVSDMPFPFKSVDDFEASIRAPIGDTFVPQTAHRKLIEPSIVTKKGAIIEPMNENMLLKQKFIIGKRDLI